MADPTPSAPPAPPVPPVLAACDVTVRFGGLVALERVDLDVMPGCVTGLIGPNGAGKTTLFNVITGLQRPDNGRVLLDGTDISAWSPTRRARAGLARTFQRLELFVGLSVRDNLMSAWEASVPGGVLGRRAAEGRALVDTVLRRLALAPIADRSAGELPTGLGRMVELGRALCTRPRVLLLDEPSSGLDATETDRFRDLLVEIVSGGGDGHDDGIGIGRDGAPAVLLVEHDVRLVTEVCARITVLDFGRRIACGTAAEIRVDPAVVAAYLGDGAVSGAAAAGPVGGGVRP